MHGRPHLVHPRAATNPIPGIVVAVIASAGANRDQTRLTHRSGAALVPLKNLRTPNSGQLGPVITAWYSLHMSTKVSSLCKVCTSVKILMGATWACKFEVKVVRRERLKRETKKKETKEKKEKEKREREREREVQFSKVIFFFK